jgi:ATP-dependent Clp protease adaptor protein ClpS
MSEQQTATATATIVRPSPVKPRRKLLPQWKVLLHNDDVNEVVYVVQTIVELTSLNAQQSFIRTAEAHNSGISLLMTTHQEHAELLEEQFQSKRLTVTIEPE